VLRYAVRSVALSAFALTIVALVGWRPGHAALGPAVGSAFLLVSLSSSVSNPAPRLLPLFALVSDPEVSSSRRLWFGVALVSAGALVASCWEGKRRLRSGPTGSTAT